MLDLKSLPQDLIGTLRESLDVEQDDDSRDGELARLTPCDAFNRALEYEGIIGYGPQFFDWAEQLLAQRATSA